MMSEKVNQGDVRHQLHQWNKPWFWVGLSVVLGIILLGILGSFIDPEGEDNISPAQQSASPVPLTYVTAQQLYDEREANATRYDVTYKGKVVRVAGTVVKIDSGDVTLGVDTTGFGINESGLFGVALRDLSQSEQIAVDKGMHVTAVCEVGDYVLGTIGMKDCKLE